MTLTRMLVAAGVVALAFSSQAIAKQSTLPLPLRLVTDVRTRAASEAYADQTPRMDYESVDPKRRLLYIAYLGADEIIVFNLNTAKVVAHVQGLAQVHGTLAVPIRDRLYASATGTDQVAVIDERTLRVLARIPGGDYPDGIAYDPENHKVFVSDERGGTVTVIDADTNKNAGTIDVGGEVGNTQYDPKKRQVYSDVQTRDEIVAIDPTSDTIVARHALPGCEHDHGLALDVPHRLAFVACDGNAKLLLVSTTAWKVLSIYDVGDDPDVLAFDPGLRRLYVASESGVVTVFQEDGQSLRLLGRAFLADDAHTVAVDPITHLVYFALQSVGGSPDIRVMSPTHI